MNAGAFLGIFQLYARYQNVAGYAYLFTSAQEADFTGCKVTLVGPLSYNHSYGSFVHICVEFKCQSAGFPGAELPDHLVCVDTLVHVRM